jgi:DNA-binding NarL/FixJ family response regulator
LTRARVLLADDHSSLLEAASAMLSPHVEIVGTARDGAALVSEALRLRPDVIVADITMPILNGIEAAHRLRECGSSAKLVFLTIHSEEEFIKACIAEGASGYVLKSRMKANLLSAVKAALDGRGFVFPATSS